jgi:hypothetical protein
LVEYKAAEEGGEGASLGEAFFFQEGGPSAIGFLQPDDVAVRGV